MELAVRVLGPTVIEAGGTSVRVDRPFERALAVRLALAHGSGVPDDTLIRDLWSEDAAAKPVERLRALVYRLRQTLGDHASAIRRTSSGYALAAEPVDLVAVDALVGADQLDEALQHWRGEALADLRTFPFGALEGVRLDALRLSLRTQSIEAKLATGQSDPAELEQLVAENPLHERVVGLSAIALYRSGRQAEALQRLAGLRKALVDELGIDPAPETIALELRILRQDPDLADQQTVRRTGVGRSAFVGRDSELETLLGLLTSPTLITLTGGPGMGKTRLAREITAAVQSRNGRPIVWLDLATLGVGEAVLPALAAAADVEAGTGDPLPRILDKLGGALLVVDNAEHLVDEVAELLLRIRSKAVGLAVLVTSQRPLRISEEEVHQVGPLSREAAGVLFCSRSGLQPSDQIDLICEALDRLPLAVELAAGLTRTLTVDQLATRIQHRLRLLVSGNRDTGIRHSSLRAALDWSHSLLESPGQLVLRRLAVFVGGCTLEAAEQVVSGDGIHPADVVPILVDLTDRCLIGVELDGEGVRYRLLETVRDFALECLQAAGEETAVRRRHAEWCTELAARTEKYGGSNHRELLSELSQEEANLRAALDWSLGPDGDSGRVLAIAAPTWWYWWSRGLKEPAQDWLRRAIEIGKPERTREWGVALRSLATLTRYSGGYAEARVLGEQALELFRELGDHIAEVSALVGLSITSITLQDFENALAQGRQAIDKAEPLDNQRMLGTAVNVTGVALRNLGRFREAEEMFTRVRDLWSDDPRGLAAAHNNLATVAWQFKELERCRELCLESLRLYRELDLSEGMVDVLELLSSLEVEEGRPAVALRLLTVSATQRLRIGSPLVIPDELAARARAEELARRMLGPDAAAVITTAQDEPIAPVVDSLLA
ncbi:hypothetical protein GCM10009745_47240 [Kribbella yunnanensis]|uniref:Tetratricopeptide repeat protein n=1 Tax=Kribbella yunnanensis TaxID=190194 RepID=A0ABN2HZN5_9ACTN